MPALASVFFDYTCPYSRRLSQLLDAVGERRVQWRPFVLAEANRDDEGASVWQRPDALTRPALLALALHEAVTGAEGDVGRFQAEVFTAFGDRRVTAEELHATAEAAGAKPDEHVLRRALAEVRASHDAARGGGVFGTPTVVTEDGLLGYLKLADLPAGGEARRRLLDVALTVVNNFPGIAEIKRPVA